ncbi:response regulator [Candidatus Uabimicrobium amorphum]|uniref:Histidine kinase n=1 Tax=Uabimicrobium amorphum TaxID=2596890 RepID=A0A5S9IUZ5_UABAM|nr:response regulator [Candidatus Uabimicrobium amorphum]BBM87802.1 histidine kinase [Candidatus Uabimicrobium amorphum]
MMKTILLVEDEKVIRTVLKILLEEKGHEVYEVDNGKKALSILEDKDFDLILMDLHMPVMSGFKAIRKLRENNCHTQAIAITASMTEEDKNKAVEAGFNDCIVKDFNATFNESIERFLQ